jgi:hypothetical protein
MAEPALFSLPTLESLRLPFSPSTRRVSGRRATLLGGDMGRIPPGTLLCNLRAEALVQMLEDAPQHAPGDVQVHAELIMHASAHVPN